MLLPSSPTSQSFAATQPKQLTVGDILPPIRLAASDKKSIALDADDIAGHYLILALGRSMERYHAGPRFPGDGRSLERRTMGGRVWKMAGFVGVLVTSVP